MRVRPYDDRVTETDETRVPGEPPGASRPADPPAAARARRRRVPANVGSRIRHRIGIGQPRRRHAAEEVNEPDPNASVARGVALATAVALAGAAAIVVLGGVLTLTEVLLVVAGFTGLGVGLALRWGAAEHLVGRRRMVIALALALGAVALGQLGLWQYGRSEGGVLGPLDYLGQVYGPLVLVEFAAAGVVAWLAAR